MTRLLRIAVSLLVPLSASGCFETRHYVEDPERMDGLFFGTVREQGEDRCDEYRAFALYGLIPWGRAEIESPGQLLADLRRRDEVQPGARIETFSKFGLVDAVLTAFVGFSGRLLFAPRTGGIEFVPEVGAEVDERSGREPERSAPEGS